MRELTKLRKRLVRLEELASLPNGSGLVPFSLEWFEYWADQSHESPQKPRIPGARMTLTEFRAVVAIAHQLQELESAGEDVPKQEPE